LTDQTGKASPEIATENSGHQQGTAIELWGKVCPQLKKALGFYDERNSDSLPDTTWKPLGKSKASYQD
jgi:hypothetical protein